MAWIATKYLITAGLVVLISELAKRSDKLGAFIASIPLVTLLTLIWLYVEGAKVIASVTLADKKNVGVRFSVK
ncbi:MAG: DUF3147 family protein [Limnobacter sp.]|jgi:hypothetical protein|uniref:DUF3147 family protein n=1 Tax=Limnobacter TaxID=131079 RepID=UPI000DB74330|nr:MULTISPECIES: DUF3147 family protein [unclassified Limnobacter]MBA4316209.1 hypothetical protein [Alcaligenaceae bacterium]PZO17158.1 MAG: hypothetical protein DCE87_04265 [Betaproteobacteria bacterium]VWX34847.1 hypothetical protein LIMNO130_30731 [Limnobacter sp. 130]